MKTVQMFYDFYAWKTEETTKVMKDMIKKKKKRLCILNCHFLFLFVFEHSLKGTGL